MNDEASYNCDSCGEEIVVPIDMTAGSRQEYVEDCPVCCCPNVIHVGLKRMASGWEEKEWNTIALRKTKDDLGLSYPWHPWPTENNGSPERQMNLETLRAAHTEGRTGTWSGLRIGVYLGVLVDQPWNQAGATQAFTEIRFTWKFPNLFGGFSISAPPRFGTELISAHSLPWSGSWSIFDWHTSSVLDFGSSSARLIWL
jgi:Cysteine-rich CPXCG